MASYTGGARAKDRIKLLEEERKQQREELERRKEAIVAAAASEKDALSTKAFEERSEARNDELLKEAPVGLVSHQDYKARRLYRERHAAEVREKAEALRKESKLGKPDGSITNTKKSASKRNLKSALSFNDSDSDDSDNDARCAPKRRRRAVVMKNPSADASFLPDRVEEEKRATERTRLRKEWRDEQERIKAQFIRITYSYWNGTGHRRMAQVKKGTNVGRFLALAQEEFREIRHLTTDSLMFVKEDLIIPHHFTFYDFIVNKARGVSC